MSLSDQDKTPESSWGLIFTEGGEHSLSSFERSGQSSWNAKDEEKYLERVRLKAESMAASLMSAAKNEAQKAHEQARREGYEKGLAEARDELENLRSGMAGSLASVLSAIEGQCSHIFDSWREDILAVVRLAVERVTALELSEKRAQSLDALINEAVALLEKRRELVIRVNPEDEPALGDILNLAKERFPDVKSWRLRADAGISPGGIMVESESSLADGRVEKRIAAVDEILKQISLAEDLNES
ncbi:MAG: flagellar assembly protein FliH [Desulfovibrio sp.]|jgi:flagellar assembly protein FliH|nr:flagellar assembly protein FliH [Desulfovibrio sp.]